MPQFASRRSQQILEDMIARVVARSNLSDVADSSSVKQMLAAAALEDDEIYYQMENLRSLFSLDTATGDDLDERAKDVQPNTISRLGPRKAVGSVVFSRTGTVGTVNIPVGTRVKTADGVTVQTTQAASITAASAEQIPGHGVGRDSLPTDVIAILAGEAGNVVSGALIRFDSRPTGVDEVINLDALTFGRDKETDDAFRQRIKGHIASLPRSTPLALENSVLGIEDPATSRQLIFAKAIEDPSNPGYVTLYIDDGTGSAESNALAVAENVTFGLSGPPSGSAVGGETYLNLNHKPVRVASPFTLASSVRGALVEGADFTLNGASGQLVFTPALVTGEIITADYTYYTGLIALAQLTVDGDPLDRATYPGIRAGGILVTVKTPFVSIITVTATLTVRDGYDIATVQVEAVDAIKAYVNSLGISDDVIRSELIRRIQQIDGVSNVLLTVPSADVAIGDDQIPRTTNANISVN